MSNPIVKKRKPDSQGSNPGKRVKLTTSSSHAHVSSGQAVTNDSTQVINESTDKKTTEDDSTKVKKRKINRLAPPRPYPTVPTSVSATGPRSAHKEGKNIICLTRKTTLGAYMRRCKDVILKDGYKTLHFSAMGAAIPLLLQLVVALPPILPFSSKEIHTEITTGTVEVRDEVIPDDEDDDLKYETRSKSTLKVIFKIGDGVSGEEKSGVSKKTKRRWENIAATRKRGSKGVEGSKAQTLPGDVVIQEPEQQEMEML